MSVAAQVGMASGLQRRLLLLLLLPLFLLASINTWFDFRSADNAALQQDRQLLSMVPLMAGSVIAKGATDTAPPVLLMAPQLEDFLNERPGLSGFALVGRDGSVLRGNDWLSGMPPATFDAEFVSQEFEGVTYRIVSQRMQTAGGELVLRLADGSDPRQQWLSRLWFKVALPNLVLVIAAFFAVNWAVSRALRPLIELKEAVERRSPRDLSALDVESSPDEVRPLVLSLNRLFDLVNAQADSQRHFIADAAHQLRTPLAVLKVQVQSALRGDVPAQEALQEMQVTVDRATVLANQMLSLAKVEQVRQLQNFATLDWAEVVRAVALDVSPLIAQKDIDFEIESQPCQVHAHEWMLRELVRNLLHNAIRHTPNRGKLSVLIEPVGSMAQLCVSDSGTGIGDSMRQRLFQPFATGDTKSGTGLGLTIAREIVIALNGTIQLNNRVVDLQIEGLDALVLIPMRHNPN